MTLRSVLLAHAQSGRYVDVPGARTFVREQAPASHPLSDVPVLLVHGVPVSSFVWRKLQAGLAARGLASVAPDLPGLGLSERPPTFDYSWTGLGAHLLRTVEALGLERVHLVVHDLGGPVGFELAAAAPERIASLTVLNTIVDADGFTKPWAMAPFAVPGLGELWLRGTPRPAFRALLRVVGIADQGQVGDDELDAHHRLLLGDDAGAAFLKIMRGFEPTAAKQALFRGAVGSDAYPVQVVWGEKDSALTLGTQGAAAARAAGLDAPATVPGKHFLQEDQAPALAHAIARLVERAG